MFAVLGWCEVCLLMAVGCFLFSCVYFVWVGGLVCFGGFWVGVFVL